MSVHPSLCSFGDGQWLLFAFSENKKTAEKNSAAVGIFDWNFLCEVGAQKRTRTSTMLLAST